jgi:hypothetical protein
MEWRTIRARKSNASAEAERIRILRESEEGR